MPGFGAIAEFAIAEFSKSVDAIITEAPTALALTAGEDVVLGGAVIGEAITELELASMMDPPSGGFDIVEQLLHVELVPVMDPGGGGASITDEDTVSFYVGPAIAEGAIGEEGPIGTFTQATDVIMFTPQDRASGGASADEAPEGIELESPTDEIIARFSAVKILTIAS